jgi:hypothetical protein
MTFYPHSEVVNRIARELRPGQDGGGKLAEVAPVVEWLDKGGRREPLARPYETGVP